MTVAEHFLFVSRYTCECGGPVMIVPHAATDLAAMMVVRRHVQTPEHRDYRHVIESGNGYSIHPETPLEPSSVEPRSIGKPSVGPDGEPGVTTRGVGTRPQRPGGVSTNLQTWSLEDELWPGRVRKEHG